MAPKSSKSKNSNKRSYGTDFDEPINKFTTMTVAALRKACTDNGLPTSGSKAILIKKLTESTEQSEEPPYKLKKEDSVNTTIRKEMESRLSAKKSKSCYKLDEHFPYASYNVHEDYSCMLNQTNINQNNNKFYVIQLLKEPKAKDSYTVFTRWGRVGENGQQAIVSSQTLHKAMNDFKKKFKDKTKNDWKDRGSFIPQPGKYTLLDIDDDDDDDDEGTKDEGNHITAMSKTELFKGELFAPCALDTKTKELISLIFDEDMFKQSMQALDLDVKKMPLGKLSKVQIAKGFTALVDIENAIKTQMPKKIIEEHTNTFYTLIPHSFGRQVPQLIDNLTLIQRKKDMLLILSDIELAQCLQTDKKALCKLNEDNLKPHPLDEKYSLLRCKLSLLNEKTTEYNLIKNYINKTGRNGHKLQSVWIVDRVDERNHFKTHDKIKERKLLWHGTNVAVVAAILSSGLRIMPHSGGRVGRGIYFASEHDKSAGYVQFAPNGIGLMFLNEVALGKEYTIIEDDYSLTAAPKGHDCVVARGAQEPDPKKDATIILDGKTVVVPQGNPIKTKYTKSSFSQSEYLIYKESQARIRYLLTFKWN